MRPGDLDDPAPIEPDSDTLDRVRARSGTFRRRRRTQRWVSVGSGALVIVIAVAIAASVSDHRSAEPAGPPSTTQPHVTAADVAGEWRPTSIRGYSGALTSPPLSDVPLLRFTNDDVVGNDGCNGFSTAYELRADGTLRTGEIGSEAELCPGAPPLQNALQETARLELHVDRLLLRAADGHELAALVRRAVTARIELPSDTMTAGSTMKGRVVVDNQTGGVIRANGCGSLFVVALSSADYQPMLAWSTCYQTLDIPAGTSTYPIDVSASRLAVGAQGPLEPGRYEATLFQSTHVLPDPAPIPIEVTTPSTTVTARIELPASTVAAGSTMKGTVVVQNDTGAPVQGSGCGDYFEVLLESDDVQQGPAWRQCLQQFTFPVGESRHPVTIATSYNACVGEARSNEFPTCVAGGGPPPLPLGDYRATLFQSDDAVTVLPPVAVEVVASP